MKFKLCMYKAKSLLYYSCFPRCGMYRLLKNGRIKIKPSGFRLAALGHTYFDGLFHRLLLVASTTAK